MGEVVDLKSRKEPEVAYWRCDCGCITHYVRSDGEIECAQCGHLAQGNGFWKLPEGVTRDLTDDDGPEFKRFDLGEPSDALSRVLRFVKPEPTACLIVLQENGVLHCWGKEFDTRARRGWLRRRLESARQLLVNN